MRRKVERLTAVIELLIQRHPRAADVLLGVAPPPTDEEWKKILWTPAPDDLGVKVQHDPCPDGILHQIARLDDIRQVIDFAGWDSIVEAARAVKTFYAEDWRVFCLHCRFVKGESRIGDASSLEKVAMYVGLSPNTVSRKRREIPQRIARDALSGFQSALKW